MDKANSPRDWTKELTILNNSPKVVVYGKAGSGKSVLLDNYVKQLGETKNTVLIDPDNAKARINEVIPSDSVIVIDDWDAIKASLKSQAIAFLKRELQSDNKLVIASQRHENTVWGLEGSSWLMAKCEFVCLDTD